MSIYLRGPTLDTHPVLSIQTGQRGAFVYSFKGAAWGAEGRWDSPICDLPHLHELGPLGHRPRRRRGARGVGADPGQRP